MKDPSRVKVTGPLERFAGGFRVELAGVGYAPDSAAQRVQLMACLSRWMLARQVAVSELTPERAQEFAEWRRGAGYAHFRSPRGLTVLLAYLRELGVAPDPVVERATSPAEVVVDCYREFLLEERGLAAGTVRYYERVARLFLAGLAAPDGALDLGRLAAGDVGRFILEQRAARSVGSAKNMVMALRSLLRFLHLDGITVGDLAGAVPAVAPQPRSLPRALDRRVVARLLASATGARGRAGGTSRC